MHEKPRAELRGGENVLGYGCNGMVRAREPIGPAAFVIVTTMAAACGCTTSALIRPDDPVFARATTRMERTITEVEAIGGRLLSDRSSPGRGVLPVPLRTASTWWNGLSGRSGSRHHGLPCPAISRWFAGSRRFAPAIG